MSFKIFSLQFSGKIKSTEKVEQNRAALLSDYQEFLKVEKSDELSKYLQLDEAINSSAFSQRKKEIESLQFKGSKEFNQLAEFEKLKKAKHIKKYFLVSKSSDLKKFEDLKESEKLKEFYTLQEFMKEGEFSKALKESKALVYKGSVEERHFSDFKKLGKSAGIKAWLELKDSEILKKHMQFADSEKLKSFLAAKNSSGADKEKLKKFKALKKSSDIKSYFKFEKSKKLKLYHETVNSHDLKKYNELKEFVENNKFHERVAFLKDKKKFEKTEAFSKQQKFKQLSSDSNVKFFLKYEKSGLLKNYLDVKDSFDLKRYHELETIINSDEFKQRKAYLEDKNKWEKTEEFAQEKECLELKKLPQLVKYFGYKGKSDFNFLKEWEIVFEDDFSASALNSEKWSTSGFISEKLLGENYSMPGDLHVVTNGDNIKTGGKLSVEVKKEKRVGKVWSAASGFVPMELDYTSGMVSSGKSFWLEDGIFEAKIRFNPVKEIVNTFYLLGENENQRINLLEMGTKNRLGVSKVDGAGKVQVEGLDIANLKKGKPYIFSVEKSGSNFTWKINETEVVKLENTSVNSKLHLNMSSIVVYDVPGSQLPSKFEIDWVKCYRKKD